MQGSSSTTIDQFLAWLEHEGKSLNTISTYQQELKKFENWLQSNNQELNDITHDDVKGYILSLEQMGKSPVTLDKILGVIRTFAKYLKRPDITMDIKIKQAVKKDDIESLSKEECGALLSEVKESENERNIAIVYMLLHTGIRVSELCALNKEDLDLEGNRIRVVSAHHGERVIPLSAEVNEHILEYLPFNPNAEPLFVSKTNERLTERSVQYMLKKYGVNAQKLRHTFCQRLIDRGVALEVVSKLAGHRDINVTKRYAKTRLKDCGYEDAIRKAFSDRSGCDSIH